MTKIEWADLTYNPITGCSHSGTPGCDHCYAKRMANRLRGRCGYPQDDPFRVTFHSKVLDKMDKELVNRRDPKRVFVCSMSDIAHDDVLEWQFRDVMETCFSINKERAVHFGRDPHTFIFLTKRPGRFRWLWEMLLSVGEKAPENFWIGVTAENQEAADLRIPELLKIDADKRFVSVEPMLGSVDLSKWIGTSQCVKCKTRAFGVTVDSAKNSEQICKGYCFKSDGSCKGKRCPTCGEQHYWTGSFKRDLDWVICGGETGPGSRPMSPEWVRLLRNQCTSANVPFFYKSWGDWRVGGKFDFLEKTINEPTKWEDDKVIWNNRWWMIRVGKKKAGRILDGKEWNEVPE